MEYDNIKDADWLRQKYWNEELTQKEIADLLDCERATVHNYMKKHGIERRNRGNPRQYEIDKSNLKDFEWLYERYWDEYDRIQDIAEDIGCSRWVVRKWLEKHDIQVRSRGSYKGHRHHNTVDNPADTRWSWGWKQRREQILERDNHTCQRCGMTNQEHHEQYGLGLSVHHNKPRRYFEDDNGDIDKEEANKSGNLVTLCRPCHAKYEGIPLDLRAVATE